MKKRKKKIKPTSQSANPFNRGKKGGKARKKNEENLNSKTK